MGQLYGPAMTSHQQIPNNNNNNDSSSIYDPRASLPPPPLPTSGVMAPFISGPTSLASYHAEGSAPSDMQVKKDREDVYSWVKDMSRVFVGSIGVDRNLCAISKVATLSIKTFRNKKIEILIARHDL